jgi:hypothetical protein
MEANEVQEFAKQMKEAGEEGGESFRSISLGISILAVLVAMVTVLGHRSHTEAVLMQSRAGDQWNEYQAKKIRMDNLRWMLICSPCSQAAMHLQLRLNQGISGTYRQVEDRFSRRTVKERAILSGR